MLRFISTAITIFFLPALMLEASRAAVARGMKPVATGWTPGVI